MLEPYQTAPHPAVIAVGTDRGRQPEEELVGSLGAFWGSKGKVMGKQSLLTVRFGLEEVKLGVGLKGIERVNVDHSEIG